MRLSRVSRFMTLSFTLTCDIHKIAGGGIEPPLPPYQSDVLPLHHRAFLPSQFHLVGTVGIEPTFSCSQDTRAPGALHPVPFFQVSLQWPVWESNPSRRLERAVSSYR